MKKKIAIIGNPNSGKTTLFNKLTGSNQHVGNWPGVTVDKKTGSFCYRENHVEIVDLPGVYSLSPYTKEEIIAREYVLKENPDGILCIVDATNLERNLYLSLQILALGKPTLIALNFMDDAKAQGIVIDTAALANILGVKVVPISAKRSVNITDLLEEMTGDIQAPSHPIQYAEKITKAIFEISQILASKDMGFYAQKLLEGDIEVEKNLGLSPTVKVRVEAMVQIACGDIKDREMLMPGAMYDFIELAVAKTVTKPPNPKKTMTEHIDEVVVNKWLALPIFALVMFIMFSATFGSFGSFFSDAIDVLVNVQFADLVLSFFQKIAAPLWLSGLVVEGILGGVGGILTFLPQILILFFFLSILEDTGYLARIAFIMDTLLRKIGLSGKSFIPMLMGFGCTTPAVMAARTMENEQDRKMTIMLTPFMSCSAKLPVYALFAGMFFADHQGLVTFSIYLLGIIVAILGGFILKHTLFKGVSSNFVLELPDYRLPTVQGTIKNMLSRAKDFIIKAGTIIFAMSVIIWFLQNFSLDLRMVSDSATSMLGRFGALIAPVFAPLGFGQWEAAVSLLTGLIAKEAVVSTMTVLYAAGDSSALQAVMLNIFTPLSAYTFMAFTLLYVPCISAFAAIKREMGSMKWALLAAGFQTGIAYVVALAIYQIGQIFIR